MTDDRVAGLPDAGTIQPGDPGHIETHDRMAELMQFAAERIGIILDPPAPKPAVIGEYGHVDAHNTLLANIEQIAREAGTAVGGPPAPVLTNPEGGSVIAFTSGGEGVGGPTIAYGAEIEPNDHGETVTVDVTDPAVGGEVAVSNTQPFTDYIVTVYGVNVAGRGDSATTDAFQLNYNEATGGNEVQEYTRLSDNTRWRYHKYTDAGTSTFSIKSNAYPDKYRILVVGGGGGGGNWSAGDVYGGAGGAGGMVYVDGASLSGDESVIVGGGGGRGGGAGGQSSIGGHTAGGGQAGKQGNGPKGGASGTPQSKPGGNHFPGPTYQLGGGGGGAGGAGGTPTASYGGAAGPGLANDITNVNTTYAVGGSGGHGGHPGSTNGAAGSGGAGSGSDSGGANGGTGRTGVVIVAYQIATTSTSRQIEQAQAEAAARKAGYATGYDVGVSDGIEQRNEEIRAAAEQVKEAVKEARPTKDKK